MTQFLKIVQLNYFLQELSNWIWWTQTCETLNLKTETSILIFIFLACVIFFHCYVFLELALILFETTHIHACMNKIKVFFFLLSVIYSLVLHLWINLPLKTCLSRSTISLNYKPALQILNQKCLTQAIELMKHHSSLLKHRNT